MKRQLLIVDDEPDQLELLRQALYSKGLFKEFDFLYASNGEEALLKLKNIENIELLLLDINMPEMDGLTLLSKVRRSYPKIQSIMISAYNDMTNIRTAMNNGAFDFVTKPLDFKDLENTIKKSIEFINELNENKRIAIEYSELRKEAVELEMQALRAQMNPHFIFNALNSINNFIQQNDPVQASDYLIKFSKLIRSVLEYTTQPVITLEQELDTLRLYIDLERLRFKQKFEYTIEYDTDLDIHSIQIPPLLLQPFVENAIYHGLMPSASSGFLFIGCKEQDKLLEIRIRDNGIGRKLSLENKSESSIKHKSLGLAVTIDRIKLFDRKQQANKPIDIIDHMDDHVLPNGTEVVINIPIII